MATQEELRRKKERELDIFPGGARSTVAAPTTVTTPAAPTADTTTTGGQVFSDVVGGARLSPTGQIQVTRTGGRTDTIGQATEAQLRDPDFLSSFGLDPRFAGDIAGATAAAEAGITDTDFITTEEEAKTDLEERFAQTEASTAATLQIQEEEARKTMEESIRQASASGAAAEAGFAQSREGAQASARPAAAAVFKSAVESRIETAANQFSLFSLQKEDIERQLEDARTAGNTELAKSLSERKASVERQQAQAEQALIEAEQLSREQAQGAREQAEQRLSFVTDQSPAAIAASPVEDIVSAYTAAGLSASAGEAFHTLNSQLNEELAKGDKADPARIQSIQRRLGQVQAESQTAAQQDIQFLQDLQDSGASKEVIDAFKARAGITGKLEAVNAAAQPAVSIFSSPVGGETAFSITAGTGDAIPNALNNPGNLKAGGAADAFAKKDENGNLILSGRGEGKFLTFDNPEDGFKAMMADIGAKQSGRTRTALTPQSSLLQFAQVYANAGQEYVDNIIKATGVARNTPIGKIDTGVLASGVAFAEGFNGVINLDPVSDVLTATEDVFISSLVKDTLGTRAVKDPAIMQRYKEAFIENGKDRDALEDLVRISGQSDLFSGSIRDAAEQISFGLSKDKKDTLFDSIDRRLGEDNVDGAKEALKAGARASVPAAQAQAVKGNERLFELIGEIKSDLADFEQLGGDTGILTGTAEAVANKIGRTSDPKVAQLATKIQKTIQGYRKAVSGAAFTESEAEEYREIFPSINKTAELNSAKIAALDDIIGGDIKFFYQTALGKQAYGKIFGGETEKAAIAVQQPAPLTPMQQLDQDELSALDAELEEIEAQLNQ